jgi:hypothetical protein
MIVKPAYYLIENCKCEAYVQEIAVCIFWRRWYWKAKFYYEGECTPYDIFDGTELTEQEAIDSCLSKYGELFPSDD